MHLYLDNDEIEEILLKHLRKKIKGDVEVIDWDGDGCSFSVELENSEGEKNSDEDVLDSWKKTIEKIQQQTKDIVIAKNPEPINPWVGNPEDWTRRGIVMYGHPGMFEESGTPKDKVVTTTSTVAEVEENDGEV